MSSNAFFVGVPTNARSGGMSKKRFEAFKDELRAIPPDVTQQRLQARLGASALLFPRAVLGRSKDQLNAAIKQHATSAMAQEKFDIHFGMRQINFFDLGWLAIAQASLEEVAASHDLPRSKLEQSIFFSENSATLSRLNKVVVWSLEPVGSYDYYAFAAGVACGDVRPAVPELVF